MRTQYSKGIKITYPDKLVYSQDKIIIDITGAGNNKLVRTLVNSFSKSFIDKKYTYAGNCSNDVSYYLNAIFDTTRNTSFSTFIGNVQVALIISTETKPVIFCCSFDVIYGRQHLLNKGYRMDFLPRYISDNAPYVYYYSLFKPSDIAISEDGIDWAVLETAQSIGIHSIDLTSYNETGCYLKIGSDYSTFDYTFDITFGQNGINVISFTPKCFRNPYTLRWLDNLGIWQTETFERVDEITNNKSTEIEYFDSTYRGLQFSEKNGEDFVNLISENLDHNNQKRITGLVKSNDVHLYSDSDWIPVTIKTNSFTLNERDKYKDIIVNVKLQDI